RVHFHIRGVSTEREANKISTSPFYLSLRPESTTDASDQCFTHFASTPPPNKVGKKKLQRFSGVCADNSDASIINGSAIGTSTAFSAITKTYPVAVSNIHHSPDDDDRHHSHHSFFFLCIFGGSRDGDPV
ncbi:hypothetical protein AVEN_88139-1, partial [Araneus ventricosus]